MANNPVCPHCGNAKTMRAGYTSTGNQRYKCAPCNRWFSPVPAGRRAEGDRTLTNAERQARHQKRLAAKRKAVAIATKPEPSKIVDAIVEESEE